MRSLTCCAVLVILAGFAAAAPQAIIDTDFGVPGKTFSDTNAELALERSYASTGKGVGDACRAWARSAVG